jgi:hypothetical protein
LNSRHNEAQLEDQKSRKAQECHLEKGKIARPIKEQKAINLEKWKRRAKISSNQNTTSKKNSNSKKLKTPPESNSP